MCSYSNAYSFVFDTSGQFIEFVLAGYADQEGNSKAFIVRDVFDDPENACGKLNADFIQSTDLVGAGIVNYWHEHIPVQAEAIEVILSVFSFEVYRICEFTENPLPGNCTCPQLLYKFENK